jgi:hypothetical protein
VYAKQPVKGELVDIDLDPRIKVEAMAKLPWKFVGFYLCPAAEVNPQTPSDADGRRLLSILCDHQRVYALEQLESLQMLVAAPDYTLRKLVTYLSPALMNELLDATMSYVSDDIYFLGSVGLLVDEFVEVSCFALLCNLHLHMNKSDFRISALHRRRAAQPPTLQLVATKPRPLPRFPPRRKPAKAQCSDRSTRATLPCHNVASGLRV